MSRRAKPKQYRAIGTVSRPHGIRGELRVETYESASPLIGVDKIYVGPDHQPHTLQESRVHQAALLIKLAGCEDRDRADAFRGQDISIAMADAPLKPGEFFQHQIIGLPVVTDEGEALGSISNILVTGANDVYVVKTEAGELLLPAIKSVIIKIEPDRVVVHLIEGLR